MRCPLLLLRVAIALLSVKPGRCRDLLHKRALPRNSSWSEALVRLVTSRGALRFCRMDPYGRASPKPSLLEACAETLETE